MAELEKKTRFLKALMALRDLVMDGELAPGERLSEVAVADRIGISRTPVREAMSQLAEEGLLDRIATGGYCVREITADDIADGIEMRGVIEGTALRIAAERGVGQEGIRACTELLDRIDAALGANSDSTDFSTYATLNAEFHTLLTGLCGSPTVRREVARVSNLPLAAPSAFLQGQVDDPGVRQSLFQAQAQHRAMVEAVSAQEGARAEALAREHARLARRNLNQVMARRGIREGTIPGLALVARA